ncbi:hypothetical protein EDB84DRAFT_1438313 [Lactarius hengduanensis]|nr:hypothetical protein EDB84DRAFT_1438313 [Lactarius hengduanensis]
MPPPCAAGLTPRDAPLFPFATGCTLRVHHAFPVAAGCSPCPDVPLLCAAGYAPRALLPVPIAAGYAPRADLSLHLAATVCPTCHPATHSHRWLRPVRFHPNPTFSNSRPYSQINRAQADLRASAMRTPSESRCHRGRAQQPYSRPCSASTPPPRPPSDPTDTRAQVSLNAPSQTNQGSLSLLKPVWGPRSPPRSPRSHLCPVRRLKTRGWPNQCSRKDKEGELIAADGLPIRCQLANSEGEFVRNPPRVTTELKHTIMQRRPELLTPYHRGTCALELSRLGLGLLVKCPLPLQGLTDGFGLRMPCFFLNLFPLPIISPLDPYLIQPELGLAGSKRPLPSLSPSKPENCRVVERVLPPVSYATAIARCTQTRVEGRCRCPEIHLRLHWPLFYASLWPT